MTDDLISPKYDDDEDDEDPTEEDDSDDTVYECPGLAATAGKMPVVSNPFYLRGEDLPHLQQPVMARGAAAQHRHHGHHQAGGREHRGEPKPISQSSIFHHGIKGVN